MIDKSVPSIYPNTIKSSALPKIPLTRGSSKKGIFQEDEHNDFVANDAVSTLNYILNRTAQQDRIVKDLMITLRCIDKLPTNLIHQK